MSELVSIADRLRNKATAKKEKAGNRVSSDTILNTVVTFLNDNGMAFTTVEGLFPTSAKSAAIIGRFRNVIIENKLDDLVWPVEDDGHVYLTKLVENDDEVENDS